MSNCWPNAKWIPTEQEPWTYWRLEGPGFVWSFRALPHIHCFVNISARIG
jgi:hypothetical protein